MSSRTRSRHRRRNSTLSRSLSHVPFRGNPADIAGPYNGLQAELDVIQRLKLSYIKGDLLPSEEFYREFVAAYKTICRSLRQHLDYLNSVKAGGSAPLIAKLEIRRVCEDGVSFINTWFLPSVQSPDHCVFLRKSTADFRRYICMAYGMDNIETRLHSRLAYSDYMAAFGVASEWLDPANPNRLGLTLNFALFYHEALGQDHHACHLAKYGFDEAVRFIDTFPEYEVPDDSFLALSILKEHMISWTSQP